MPGIYSADEQHAAMKCGKQ